MRLFNEINAHERDFRLGFDAATHTYRLDGCDGELTSVTTLVESCFPEFDSQGCAARVAAREGVDVATVLERWDAIARDARVRGTAMHDRIERYYLGEENHGAEESEEFRLFRMFADVERLHPYRTEWRIYHEDYGIAGTLDFLELTPEGTYNIYDWKRSIKLIDAGRGTVITESPYRTMSLAPLSLPDTSYWHYALQVSVYRYILQEKYGIRVTGMKLGVFHPAYDRPWIITLPYLEDQVVAVLRHHFVNKQMKLEKQLY